LVARQPNLGIQGRGAVHTNSALARWGPRSHQGEIPLGQRIYFERLTRLSPRISVMILCGNAETMQCDAVRWIYGGQLTDWQPATLDDVIRLLNSFASWAQVQRAAA
jgi:hypothetical protein